MILAHTTQIVADVSHAGRRMSPTRYRLVVKGELGARYASAFERMTISAHDGITEMTGEIIGPAQLQGLPERIAGLGLTPHSLTPLETENGEAAAPAPSPDQIQTGHGRTPRSPASLTVVAPGSVSAGEMHISLAGMGKSQAGAQSKGS